MTAIDVHLSAEDVARIADAVVTKMAALRPIQPPERAGHAHLTVNEASTLMRCSTRWIRHLVAVGRLQTTRVGVGPRPRVLIPRASIERLLAESTT
jgi:excisionase family DNA binding protein